jgi:hypothetical protein
LPFGNWGSDYFNYRFGFWWEFLGGCPWIECNISDSFYNFPRINLQRKFIKFVTVSSNTISTHSLSKLSHHKSLKNQKKKNSLINVSIVSNKFP